MGSSRRTRYTREEGFFGPLASTQRDYALRTDEFIAQDDKVIMVGGYGATVTATGESFDLPLVHVWTIQNGKEWVIVGQNTTETVGKRRAGEIGRE